MCMLLVRIEGNNLAENVGANCVFFLREDFSRFTAVS